MHAANSFERSEVGAHFFVHVVVAAFAHEVKIELAEEIGESVSVASFDGFAVTGAIANAVRAGSGCAMERIGQRGFKKSFRAQAARGSGFGGALEEDTGVGGAGAEEANDPAVAGRMRAEQSERIGVAAREQGVDLRFDARIPGWRGSAGVRRGGWLFFVRHGAWLRRGRLAEAGYSVQGRASSG